MEGVLNLNGGDYRVWLNTQEIELLQNNISINGALTYIKGEVSQIHKLTLVMIPRDQIRKLKSKLREEGKFFYEGPHVMIEVAGDVHTVSYIQEEVSDLSTKIIAGDPFGYQENRYDSFTGRKIFLYPQTEQG